MSRIMTCIYAEKVASGTNLRLGHDYLTNESDLDSDYYAVEIAGKTHQLLRSRFAPVNTQVAKDAKRGRYKLKQANEEPAGEDIKDTKRYALKSGKQLLDVLRDDLLTDEEYRGFLKGNIWKYSTRYAQKNGIADLEKAQVYQQLLVDFEKGLENNVQKEETNHCDA